MPTATTQAACNIRKKKKVNGWTWIKTRWPGCPACWRRPPPGPADHVLRIMQATGTIQPLRWLCAEHGFFLACPPKGSKESEGEEVGGNRKRRDRFKPGIKSARKILIQLARFEYFVLKYALDDTLDDAEIARLRPEWGLFCPEMDYRVSGRAG